MSIIEKCRDILVEYKSIIFAYIFGSYAQGKDRVDSDIDIAIFLEENVDIDTYLEMKMRLEEACKREIDLIILNDTKPLLRYEIYKSNVPLFCRDKSLETRFKVKTLFEYSDFKKYLDLSYDKTIERLREEVKVNG